MTSKEIVDALRKADFSTDEEWGDVFYSEEHVKAVYDLFQSLGFAVDSREEQERHFTTEEAEEIAVKNGLSLDELEDFLDNKAVLAEDSIIRKDAEGYYFRWC